jgi:chromosome segregation ATPase
MQLEEEKLEILGHAEDYHNQVTTTEKKMATIMSEKSRLEARIHKQEGINSNEAGDVEVLKVRLAEAQASLTEMQIINNRLDSSLRERSMDYDAAVRRSKEMIGELTYRVDSLKAENDRLMQRCEDLAIQTIDGQQNFDMEKIEWDKSAALSQIQYASKINELEQTVKRLAENQNLVGAKAGKKDKDFTDDLFSVSCISRSVKGFGADNKSLFSFANQDKVALQPFGTESRWQDDDVNSHQLVKELQRQGSRLLEGRDAETVKENDTAVGNLKFPTDIGQNNEKHHGSKRNSVMSFGQNSIESVPQSRRMSYAASYVPIVQTEAKKKVSFHGEPSSPSLLKAGNIDDIDENEESASEADENNDRFLRLIAQLNEKGDELAKLQEEHEILKTNFNALKNELELKHIDVKNLQSKLEMNEKNHQASKASLQGELDRITQHLVQIKTKYNEIESQKDLDQLVHNKALKAKNIEISLLRTQMDEVAGEIKRKSTAKKTG